MTDGEQEVPLVISLLNWRKLTSRTHQINQSALLDGLDHAASVQSDMILSTEIGASASTAKPAWCPFEADWTIGAGKRAGEGVGAFIGPRLQERWTTIQDATAPSNTKFNLVDISGTQVLIGVFYAPHVGRGHSHLMQFYLGLDSAWRRLCVRHPRALRILAGDANLPSMWTKTATGDPVPTTRVELFFSQHFLANM